MSTYNLTTNDAGIQSAPVSLTRAGDYYWGNGSLGNRGSDGYYWESMVYSSTYAKVLNFYSTNLNPQHSYYKGLGFSLRCVVR